MATSYVGYRNVLKGRNTKDQVNPYTGKTAVYSNYALFDTSSVLDEAPDKDVEVGSDRPYSKPTLLAYIFSGRPHIAPLKEPGNYLSAPYGIHKYYGLVSNRALNDPGHTARELHYSGYSNFIYDGAVKQPLADPGQVPTFTKYYGPFKPYVFKGVGKDPMDEPGHAITGDKINEWRGVPSSRAL